MGGMLVIAGQGQGTENWALLLAAPFLLQDCIQAAAGSSHHSSQLALGGLWTAGGFGAITLNF